jgi:ubiquinone/menaquinone biosynthesis C-methylase UbiE
VSQDIFDPLFVKGVFDRCSTSYRYWSQIASFGFVWIWRRQCIDALPEFVSNSATVADLMAGTGETWPYLLKRHPQLGRIAALDISEGMVRGAVERLHALRADRISIIQANVLEAELPTQSADALICTFGLKTFNKAQQARIAQQVAATLKPGGVFSFVEASDPKNWMFRPFYNFYLRNALPMIERLFLRGAQDFAMLGVYSKEFQNCGHFAQSLRSCGLEVELVSYFFGCATGVVGKKPGSNQEGSNHLL